VVVVVVAVVVVVVAAAAEPAAEVAVVGYSWRARLGRCRNE
jgi:hypothetical protein